MGSVFFRKELYQEFLEDLLTLEPSGKNGVLPISPGVGGQGEKTPKMFSFSKGEFSPKTSGSLSVGAFSEDAKTDGISIETYSSEDDSSSEKLESFGMSTFTGIRIEMFSSSKNARLSAMISSMHKSGSSGPGQCAPSSEEPATDTDFASRAVDV